MSEAIIKVGDVILIRDADEEYRVIFLCESSVTLCKMKIDKFVLLSQGLQNLISMKCSGEIKIIRCKESPVFDIEKISPANQERYYKRKKMMAEVTNLYAPSFMDLAGKKQKPELKAIMKKYGYDSNRATFWRICRQYFQSGMQDYALLPDYAKPKKAKRANYCYTKKPGRHAEYYATGVVPSQNTYEIFAKALEYYKKDRTVTIKKAYDFMIASYYSSVELAENGVKQFVPLPASQRPTLRQLQYYFSKHLTLQEKDLLKTSAQEQRNNKRLLLGDTLEGVMGPGDLVEIDACEADVSLVSSMFPDRSIGRPIVYFMIDVYTKAIIAVSISLENNSVLGFTNLMLNLGDDKHVYCQKYGVDYNNDDLWPSNFIPSRIRVDRGSEFKSASIGRICTDLGIERQLVSGASGSLKGNVEQSFHQMHADMKVHLENHGLIEQRYDSNHHKEATLNIGQFTKMVINFILMHNQKYMENYHRTRDMVKKGIEPIPAILWKYGIGVYGERKPIINHDQYLYTLMTPVKAKLSRKGISYRDLYYLPQEDPQLFREMYKAGNKRIPFEARMDFRDVEKIYYCRDEKLVCAILNPSIQGNAEYAGFTMKEWTDLRKERKKMNAKGKIHNEQISAYTYAQNANIVGEAKKTTYSEIKGMRAVREKEKQFVSSENRISDRLDEMKKIENEKQSEITEVSEKEQKRKEYSSFEEAIADFNDRY